MSNKQFAFHKTSAVPDRASLQASITALGFKLELDPELSLLTDSGFSSCTLDGIPDVGFELSIDPTEDVVGDDDELGLIASNSDICISMTWRSSMLDCACVMIVSCALAKDYGAVISFEGAPPESLESLLHGAKAAYESAISSRGGAVAKQHPSDLDASSLLRSALSSAIGERAKIRVGTGMLILSTGPALRVISSAWQATTASDSFDCSRYSLLREAQMELLRSSSNGRNGATTSRLRDIDSQLDTAGELDERDAELAADFFGKCNNVTIRKTRWEEPNKIVFEVDGDSAMKLTWQGLGTSSISVSSNDATWSIGIDGVSLL